MADRRLRIAAGVTLPLDAVTQTFGILARKGAGKTYTAAVFAEELIGAGLPVVILDPLGAFWGLRSSADGEKAGLPVTILGGEHGDVPLDPHAGKVIADLVVEQPGAYILDLSSFESNAAQDRFVTDFAERLYRLKAADRSPLHLIVDEADSFAPQRPMPGQQRMLGAFEAIVRRGRIRGLGVTLITQRPAVLNKNVLTQIECLIVLQITSPQDRKAIDEWVAGNGTKEERDELVASLAALQKGEAWFWSPSWLQVFTRGQVRRRRTFDSSKTPQPGEVVEPKRMAPVDLERLRKRMAAAIARAESEDPKKLQARIRELEREAAARPAEQVVETVVEYVDRPVLNGEIGELKELVRELVDVGQTLQDVGGRIVAGLELVASANTAPERAARAAQAVAERPRSIPSPRPPAPAAAVSAPRREVSGEIRLKAGARRMLVALAQVHPRSLSRQQLSFLADVKIGGTFTDYLRSITEAGYAYETDAREVALTDAGIDQVRDHVGLGAPGRDELIALYSPRLKAGARRMLEVLLERHPEPVSRAELSELADVRIGGTFTDYLRSLTSNRLADATGGVVGLSDELFLGEGR